jgi:RimJ/RimL family protein N-acetyltransferase
MHPLASHLFFKDIRNPNGIRMNYILETDRLKLREFITGDTAFIIELLNSPGWIQFIGNRNMKTEEEAKAYLENGLIKSYKENGFGLWLVEMKENGTPIGMCGIVKRVGLDDPDIGFAFLPGYEGKGYALEVAQATMHYAKERLNLKTVKAITVPANVRSIRLLEKIGMRYVEPLCLPGSNEELMLFSSGDE